MLVPRWCKPGIGPMCREGEYVALFEAYLDDGGIPDVKLLCMACYLARAERWERLVNRWDRLFQKHKIDHIHSVDLTNPHAKHYSHLDMDTRRAIMMEAADDIADCVDYGIVTSLSTHEYSLLTDNEFRTYGGSAYSFSMCRILEIILHKLRGLDEPDTVLNVWIEGGNRYESEALEFLSELKRLCNSMPFDGDVPANVLVNKQPFADISVKIGDYGVGSKSGPAARIPLQAADLLAYGQVRAMNPDLRDDDIAHNAVERIGERVSQISYWLHGDHLVALIDGVKETHRVTEDYRKSLHSEMRLIRRIGFDVTQEDGWFKMQVPEDFKWPELPEEKEGE